MSAKKWAVYLVRCSDNSLYCGISNDLTSRLVEHNSGKGAKYTRSRRPVELAGIGHEMTKSEALKLEYRIKQFPAEKKLSKLSKETNTMVAKKDLLVLIQEIKTLNQKLDKLLKGFIKTEQTKAAKKPIRKTTKTKTVKRASAKKAASKKKTAQPTATDQVLKIINRSKKGVDVPTLIKKTGFDDKKIRNILYRNYKQARIKRVGKGIYFKL